MNKLIEMLKGSDLLKTPAGLASNHWSPFNTSAFPLSLFSNTALSIVELLSSLLIKSAFLAFTKFFKEPLLKSYCA